MKRNHLTVRNHHEHRSTRRFRRPTEIAVNVVYRAENLIGAPLRYTLEEAWADRQRGFELDALFDAMEAANDSQHRAAREYAASADPRPSATANALEAIDKLGRRESLLMSEHRAMLTCQGFEGEALGAIRATLAGSLLDEEDYDYLTAPLRAVGVIVAGVGA